MLPVPVNPCLGRGWEVDAITRLLTSARLVTLTGPGGSGKTRLALDVAHRLAPHFADGAYFVDLAPLAQPERLAATVAAALGIPERPRRPQRKALADCLRTR